MARNLEKKCSCLIPKTASPVIDGYKGKVVCTCGGSFDYPAKKPETSGDPIADWVNRVEANHNEPGQVVVLMRLLLRIDSKLSQLLEQNNLGDEKPTRRG